MSVACRLRPATTRVAERLHGVPGGTKNGSDWHDDASNDDIFHNSGVVVEGLLFRDERKSHDLAKVFDIGKGTHKNIWNNNGFAQWSVDHDTALLEGMSLRETVSAQKSYKSTQFVSPPAEIESAQELKREFDLYVNDPRSQFEVAGNCQVSRSYHGVLKVGVWSFPPGLRLSPDWSVTPSDWHGGEESPVTNEPAAATDTVGDYLRKPAAVVSGQIIREGDAPRETGRFGGVASCPDTDFPHSSALSSLRQTDTARAAFLPAALANLFTKGQLRVCLSVPAFAFTRDRRASLGAATGVGLSLWQDERKLTLLCRNQHRSQSPAPFLPRLGLSCHNARLAATSGRCATIHPNAPSALSRWHSQCRRGLMNSFLRSRVQQSKQSRGVFNILLRQSLRCLSALHEQTVTGVLNDQVLRNSASAGAKSHG